MEVTGRLLDGNMLALTRVHRGAKKRLFSMGNVSGPAKTGAYRQVAPI